MKVLQQEHAGLPTGPNILRLPNGRAAAAIPKVRRSTEAAAASRSLPRCIGVQISLGGVRRSFAVSPGLKSIAADESASQSWSVYYNAAHVDGDARN